MHMIAPYFLCRINLPPIAIYIAKCNKATFDSTSTVDSTLNNPEDTPPKILQLCIQSSLILLLHKKQMTGFSSFDNGMKHFNTHLICLTPNIRPSFAIVLNSSYILNVYGERTLKVNISLLSPLHVISLSFLQLTMMLGITVSSQQMPSSPNVIGGHLLALILRGTSAHAIFAKSIEHRMS